MPAIEQFAKQETNPQIASQRKEYPHTIEPGIGGYLRVVYRGEHPGSAIGTEDGYWIGTMVCADCRERVNGLYRVGETWICTSCRENRTERNPKPGWLANK